MDIENYVNALAGQIGETPTTDPPTQSLESVLKGMAIELWSDAAGSLFLVADEEDARTLAEPRGKVYTASEVRRVVQISDPAVVREIHEWKRTFNGRIRE